MSEYDNKIEDTRLIHLIILFIYTFSAVALSFKAIFQGWEGWAVVVCICGLLACWIMHLGQVFAAQQRLWIYELLQMVLFFYYGVHDDTFLDLTPIIILVIIVYHMTGTIGYIYLAAGTYMLTVFYVLIMLRKGDQTICTATPSRVLLHIFVVLLAVIVTRTSILMRKKDELIAEEKVRQLEEDNRRTEDFLTNVSHELRTPINAVTGISAVLLKSEINAKIKTGLMSIREAGHRLFEQIGDILDHTEINTGKLVISEDAYMISSMISDIMAEMTLLGVKADVDVIFDVDVNVPAVLLGDVRKIKKIIRHLIENAIKFTRVGGARIRIEAIRKSYGINLCIEVSDTGIGIEDADLNRITEQFFQMDSSRSRSAGGLGLGLSIVAGLVGAMNGFMQISSEKGEGTTVSLSLPQKVADAAPCMTLEHPDEVNVCCYIRPALYANMKVWDFYNEMVNSMAKGMQVPIHRVTNIAEMKNIESGEEITHVLMGWDEYEANAAYFDSLSEECSVIVIADEGVAPTENTKIRLLRRPLSPFPIINILNSSEEKEEKLPKDGRMLCPGAHVLVVDDEVMNIVVARGIFKEYQISVESAMSGAEALDICKDQSFDIIFMDHMMPEMDGVEAEHQLRQLPFEKEPVIVALTANAVSGAREMFLSEGFDDFLSKPIETTELERVFRKFLPPSKVIYDEVETGKNALKEPLNPKEKESEEGLNDIREGLKLLLTYLGDYEAVSAEELLARMDASFGRSAKVHEALKSIMDDVKAFDMQEAVKKTKKLQQEIGGGR